MKIAVLSGKGGAGKTFLSVNLAAVAPKAVYLDCDVEEPNGRLFLKPEALGTQEVTASVPAFDLEKCIGCRACTDFCRFNALVFIKNRPKLFQDVCHACGGCQLVCPVQAITETKRVTGQVETGWHKNVQVVTGLLNLGEASGIPVIKKVLEFGTSENETVVIDCPPGSACSVMESVEQADYCVLVAEPTAFGFHNFCMVWELVTLLKKPCGVVINKMDEPYKPLEDFCKEHKIEILEKIPYSKQLAALTAQGGLICEQDETMKARFKALLNKIEGEIK